MCGIFAYSGPRPAAEVLTEGLKRLEYRGYDSAGLAFFQGCGVKRVRAAGAVSKLESLLKRENPKGGGSGRRRRAGLKSLRPRGGGRFARQLGIGHTRWATHGPPSEKNAHPHKASSVYVVHNGALENESELRQIIRPKKLASDTDTELIACLIAHFYSGAGRSGSSRRRALKAPSSGADGSGPKSEFFQSALKAMALLKGAYAVAAICGESPGELIAFKKGPPLMLCRGKEKGEFFVSSDPYAAGPGAQELIFLEDGDILHLWKNKFRVFQARPAASRSGRGKALGKPAKPAKPAARMALRAPVRWAAEGGLPDKGKYPHFMLKEIFEQPQAAARLVGAHTERGGRGKSRLRLQLAKGSQKRFDRLWEKHSRVLIVACGSSCHAALFAKYIMEEAAPIQADVESASEFIYRKTAFKREGPALFISQSGETADILKALNQAKKAGQPAISLCNVRGSSLERRAGYGLSMLAGQEIGVASTKTFSASLILLSMLALHIGAIKDSKGRGGARLKAARSRAAKERAKIIKSLLSLPAMMEEALGYDRFFLSQVERLKKFSGFFFLGRGASWPIALEGALKLKEISYLHAEGYPAGEMKHGPLAMIDENMLAVFLLPPAPALCGKMLTNLNEARARGAGLMAIGGPADLDLKNLCSCHLPLPKTHHLLQPVLSLIPLQLMAYFISRSFGYNADRPRNLAKSVTVE